MAETVTAEEFQYFRAERLRPDELARDTRCLLYLHLFEAVEGLIVPVDDDMEELVLPAGVAAKAACRVGDLLIPRPDLTDPPPAAVWVKPEPVDPHGLQQVLTGHGNGMLTLGEAGASTAKQWFADVLMDHDGEEYPGRTYAGVGYLIGIETPGQPLAKRHAYAGGRDGGTAGAMVRNRPRGPRPQGVSTVTLLD